MANMRKQKQRQAGYPPMDVYVSQHPLVEAMLETPFDELRKTQGRLKVKLDTKDSTDDEARSNRPQG